MDGKNEKSKARKKMILRKKDASNKVEKGDARQKRRKFIFGPFFALHISVLSLSLSLLSCKPFFDCVLVLAIVFNMIWHRETDRAERQNIENGSDGLANKNHIPVLFGRWIEWLWTEIVRRRTGYRRIDMRNPRQLNFVAWIFYYFNIEIHYFICAQF